METGDLGRGLVDLSANGSKVGPKFKSVRRALKVMDLVSQHGEKLTAKRIARELGTSLSSCYYLINILADEKYIEKVPHGGGYRIGPTVSMLHEYRAESCLDVQVESVIEELAKRAQRQAYLAVLLDGEVTVVQVKAPPDSPPAGVAQGFHGASHALALGKVLLAGMGSEYVQKHIEAHGLEAFTPRTIVHPTQLHAQLNKVRMVGVGMDFEEFAQNLCCVAAPVESPKGEV
ncbi:MAG: IclR family transcriptional regulator C-terminal domain-containing protein, partial [Rubrobacteraceae bacterium]